MQNIGERLEEARKRKGISIREAAEATKVRGDYLHKFESNQFDINLPDIYVRGFLRNYAHFLNLPAEKIINDYNSLGHGGSATSSRPKPLNRETYGRMDLTVSSSKDSGREDDDDGEAGADSEGDNPATFKPKPGALPYVDKALLVKGSVLVAAVVALIVLVVITVRAFSGGGEDNVATDDTATQQVASDPTIVVHALGNVRVKIVEESTGVEIFQGAITRGDSRTFPKNGQLLFTADPMENVEVEIDGSRSNISAETGLRGRQRVRIE
ncbi:helix-turn-helix domain-containing protein [Actomonas aquatica]|uniref:Helix-turn-helix domain-containing protein n=1 Tax=Actomonas aquatica TaxID=2866162 RepID=A0ABZ1CDT6_9BACT|nr:helix-turn-helix domain-containing protein [Opitutus sp. WL0086]WRQ89847.1 helix-turn-helix domain-containing protein [Opitutus sp. WL0086]